ncbi:MAG: ATP-binding protein [Victivallales bacterium]|nr:ATP-binding protein [Victivallales bacterium]
MKQRIIGRIKEQRILETLYRSDSSEFVAVYGRCRVGKTFLVHECFDGQFIFEVSGLANRNTIQQLENFRNAFQRFGGVQPQRFKNWQEAFEALIKYVMNSRKKRKLIFFDELPWMDTPKSNFISALEGFWNGWAAGRHDIILVVCGSATSWITNNLINNHGGLHNRLTRQIYLRPFSLAESQLFLLNRHIILSSYELAVCYMIFGGIPYYLNLIEGTSSLSQNIDSLVFDRNGELHYEFNNLYAALFKNSQDYIKVVEALGRRRDGLTRKEIQDVCGFKSGGSFSTILDNLEHCGFIRQYSMIGNGRRTCVYQLVDFFTLFYLHFLKDKHQNSSDYWQSIQGTSKFYSWAGLTFELLVLCHIDQLKQALGIQGVASEEYAYRTHTEKNVDAQIDLMIDRKDNTISLCEAKFTEGSYVFSQEEELKLRNRMLAVRAVCAKHKTIQLVLITTFGVAGGNLRGVVNREITLDDLIKGN